MLGAAGQQAPGALGLAVIVRKMPHTFEGERIRRYGLVSSPLLHQICIFLASISSRTTLLLALAASAISFPYAYALCDTPCKHVTILPLPLHHSCNHYQWIWCPGVAGNQKCKGSNRHDSCPKYLAKSTFWKHTKKIEGRGGEGVATEDHADEPAPGFSPASEPASDHSPESPYWLP
jgi:hypothetical protein